ncbi:MAG: hypothetical protein V9G15_03425 [Dermatophilaceae bacterium]|jgi:hypothetical protein
MANFRFGRRVTQAPQRQEAQAEHQEQHRVSSQTVAPNTVASPREDIAAAALRKRNRQAPRTKDLVDAVLRIDTTHDPGAVQELMDWINEQYAARQSGTVVGLFGKCYLGSPYLDHQMSLSGHILEHYTPDDALPAPFLPARGLARSDAYAYIEVYDDGLVVPVRRDGTTGI